MTSGTRRRPPLTVAANIFDLAITLHHSNACEYVIVTSVPARVRYPDLIPSYPSRASRCNHILRNLLEPEGRLSYWKHFGLANPVSPSFLPDGVHFNSTGMLKLYRSMRRAVLKGHRVMDLPPGDMVDFNLLNKATLPFLSPIQPGHVLLP